MYTISLRAGTISEKAFKVAGEERVTDKLNLAEPVRLGWVGQKKSGIPGRRNGLNKGAEGGAVKPG